MRITNSWWSVNDRVRTFNLKVSLSPLKNVKPTSLTWPVLRVPRRYFRWLNVSAVAYCPLAEFSGPLHRGKPDLRSFNAPLYGTCTQTARVSVDALEVLPAQVNRVHVCDFKAALGGGRGAHRRRVACVLTAERRLAHGLALKLPHRADSVYVFPARRSSRPPKHLHSCLRGNCW